ncbi:4Fe-4S dicluster domain-containing protein [Tepidibacillus fermentans]|uniref:Respiratory nitrite reductase-specific menaquinol--cytochrome-c reductase complex Fe-S cluster subunit NrfC n=1 Tax=Tepidibacillus fermentans TaxID=1281767 RepID=A0A4R3KDC7_9BACI|nr:4Fe-4S dicluster domain-containing protein [Tepidibacillus fermentans]TCS81276.1 respiratory nitrite reductase-specific menaquinol--cytochrome-c reductase complex Fe-S cluster subunit NrfC [Tepidibacillus fermentans]
MARYGMLIDTTRCVSCFACRLACQMKNELEQDEAFIHFVEKEEGIYPKVKVHILPIQCQHCENAPCMKVCPTGATYKTADGIVLVDENKCIGCKYCVSVCPYNARIEVKQSKTIQKCNFCSSELEKGGEPACVKTCIPEARIFGDLDDPNSKISQEIKKRHAKPILANQGTKPKIYYVSEMSIKSGVNDQVTGLTDMRSEYIKPAGGVLLGATALGLAGNFVVASLSKSKQKHENHNEGEEDHE